MDRYSLKPDEDGIHAPISQRREAEGPRSHRTSDLGVLYP